MAHQEAFPFDQVEQERLTPVAAPSLPPVNGTTTASRHASYTGALAALKSRSANISMLRQLWREPLTIQEVSAITKLPLASVCSLKALLGDELVDVGFDIVLWGDGRRTTKRTKWQLRKAAT